MNITEMTDAICKGEMITHRFFTDKEFITIAKDQDGNTCFRTEEGCLIKPADFWKDRQDEAWNKDWYIIKKPFCDFCKNHFIPKVLGDNICSNCIKAIDGDHEDDFEDDDDEDFIPCADCDGHPACEDFGCAIANGLGHTVQSPL